MPLEIKGKEWVSLNAYVDSGAGYSVFNSRIGIMLGLNLESGKKIYVTVVDDSQIIVYLHKIPVKIAGKEFKATIGFSRHLSIGFNVISRADIFDRFKICFDERGRVVEFHPKY